MPLDALITGRIATLAGDDRGSAGSRRSGSGTVGSRSPARGGPRDPGRPVHGTHPPRAGPGRDPRADRRPPAPRAGGAGVAPGRPRRSPDTRGRSRRACARRTSGCRPTPGSRATAGTPTAGAAGRRPTRWKRSRRVADARSGRTTITRCGPATRRSARRSLRRRRPAGRRHPAGADGTPEGVLYEAATRLVTIHVPPPSADDLERAIIEVGPDLVSLGVVACHDPGGVAPDRRCPTRSRPTRDWLSDAGRLPVRVHACMRDDAVAAAIEQGFGAGRRWAPIRRPCHRRLAEVLRRRVARVAHRRPARDIEPEPDRPLPPTCGAASG